MNDRYEIIFKPLQNGSDVRGSAIATEKEPRNLTPEIAADIAAGFLVWLEKKTGKPASKLKIGVGHDSRLTADIIKRGVLSGLSGALNF
jgi:phosphomannomutase